MKLKKREKWFSRYDIGMYLSFLLIVVLGVAFAIILYRYSLSGNVKNRAAEELQATSQMQAAALTSFLEAQYQPLREIEGMLLEEDSFSNEAMRPVWQSMVNANHLCMLALADTNGDATNYMGERMGSISDRSYFSVIANGEAQQSCEYLPNTKSSSGPRIMFSIPIYQNGVFAGVLFESKEAFVLEDALFGETDFFNASSVIFLCDADGNLIIANDSAYAYLGISDFTENHNVYACLPELNVGDAASVQQIRLDNRSASAVRTSLEINGWSLYCIVNDSDAQKAYARNLNSMRKMNLSLTLVFIAALTWIIVQASLNIRRKNRESAMLQRSYENYRILLNAMKCAVWEYAVAQEEIIPVQSSLNVLDLGGLSGAKENYLKYKKLHPEFDFQELENGISVAKQTAKTYSYETIILPDEKKLYWLRVILVPIAERDGRIARILTVVLDVSDMHNKIDNMVDTFAQIPGGIHRCYLDSPIHLEYFSESLCQMLGYTHEEVEAIVQSEMRYSLLIYPEDRPAFRTFVHSLAENGGTQSCEYRMICKDGSLLSVMDTMEAKRSDSGVMYGYSVVTDLSDYTKMRQKIEQELNEIQSELNRSKTKTFNTQMQPHFLYNALSAIREIVLEDPEHAAELIYDFTVHLRACIKFMASDDLISFSKELENTKAYVNIEKMRLGERLHVQYDCEETDFQIIPLSIQPLVENAIRHGVYERGAEGGTVAVRSFRRGDYYIIEVNDDGVGFDFNAVMQETAEGKRDSTGLMNLIFRFEKVMRANVAVDSQIGVGTKITVSIPIGEKI